MVDFDKGFQVVMKVLSLTSTDLKVIVLSENVIVAPEGEENYIYLKKQKYISSMLVSKKIN